LVYGCLTSLSTVFTNHRKYPVEIRPSSVTKQKHKYYIKNNNTHIEIISISQKQDLKELMKDL
jgi:hypothetical protein